MFFLQCEGILGICPDESIHGRNDVSVISGDRNKEMTTITYSRPFETNDKLDINIPRDWSLSTVLAIIGDLNHNKKARYQKEFVTEGNTSFIH